LLSLAEAKEKILMALSARKLVERGWLTALLGYLIKREEVEVRLKYIGDLRLQRKNLGPWQYLHIMPPCVSRGFLRSWLRLLAAPLNRGGPSLCY